MAKVFSEYYGLSLNYTCCVPVCFPVGRAFHSSCYQRIQTETSNASQHVLAGGAEGLMVRFSLAMLMPRLVDFGVDPV